MHRGKRKAYTVGVRGAVVREFLVHAESAAEVREIMDGDRQQALAVDDTYEEVGLTRVRRAPEEDE